MSPAVFHQKRLDMPHKIQKSNLLELPFLSRKVPRQNFRCLRFREQKQVFEFDEPMHFSKINLPGDWARQF